MSMSGQAHRVLASDCSSLARVTTGKAKFCLRMVMCFFPGFSGFCPPLMNNQLCISEILLKGP